MKSFALALLGASAEALVTTTIASAVTTSGATAWTSLDSITIEYGYDATNLYMNATMEATLTATPSLDADRYQIAALIPYDATPKQYAIGCAFDWSNTNTQFTPTWIFMDKAADSTSPTAGEVYTSSNNFGTAKFARAGTATANNVQASVTTDAADSTNTTFNILSGSTAKLDTASKKIYCTVKAKLSGVANISTAATSYAQMDGVAEGSNNVFLGSTTSTSTIESKNQTITTVSAALTSSTATGTGNVTYTGTGHTTTHITASSHVLSTWTNSSSVYVDFDMVITSDTALANSKNYAIMTCAKVATATWYCPMMKITGTGASQGQFTWKVYSSTTAPGSFTANQLPDNTANLGATATFIPEFTGLSITPASNASAGAQLASKAGFRNNTKWAWSAAGNTISSDGKTFNGKLQYVSAEADANAAGMVQTWIQDYSFTSYVGVYDDQTAASAAYGSKALASSANTTITVSTSTTTTGAAIFSMGASALAIALAYAF